jgi:glycosyltransferase involved in cell wall biosynthesis
MILYLGSFSSDRGLETAIQAMKWIGDEIPNAHLLLVGSGKNMPELQVLTREEGLQNRVSFVGWIPFVQVASYMAASKICIIPQPSNAANDTTLPHKLFQYMLIEKPVLTSNANAEKFFIPTMRWILLDR